MKTLLFTFICVLTFSGINSQEKFNWEIKDSVNKSASEIYTVTKQFIGETWKNPSEVIKNDDKDGGIILVRGLTQKIIFTQMGATYAYTYRYNVTFRMKENRYFFTINNIRCHSTLGSSFDNKFLIEPHDIADCPYAKKKKFAPKCNGLMEELKGQLQSIADAYKKAISEEPSSDDW
tara:strand:+ start:49 stop:579 length:531 start_codon:yes stop_codon:yes gene_type:complete